MWPGIAMGANVGKCKERSEVGWEHRIPGRWARSR